MEMIAQLRWQDGVDIGIITFLIGLLGSST
jgi:hypothetical protein